VPRLPAADADQRADADVVTPEYGGGALSDLLPSVLAALGVPGEVDLLGLPPAQRYCVLLVDGLGWRLLRRHPGEAPFLTGLAAAQAPGRRTLTTGLPSTTVTSVTSLGTGLVPGRHGLVGYTSRVQLPGGPALLNALSWDQPVDPEQYQPHPTAFERGAAAGVAVTSVSRRRFRASGLTRAALRGPTFFGADTVGEVVADAATALGPGGPALAYVYDSDLDHTGHARGWRSAAWAHQLAATDRLAEAVAEVLPPGTVLVITGDHGMVDVGPDSRVDVEADPVLADGVELVGGEARFRQLYVRPGAADDVAAAWSDRLGGRALVRMREQAVAAGWFGAVEARVADRLGDVVVAALGDVALVAPTRFPVETRLVGMHGSVTPDEALVPLLVTRC
jgi:hypothetical protein